jgi:hypothetical protein
VRGAQGRRARAHQPRAGRVPEPPPHRRGSRHRRVHHSVHRRPAAEVHAEWWSPPLRPLHPHRRLRPLHRQASPVPDRPLRYLLCVEGQRHREELQLYEGVPGEELQGDFWQGNCQARYPCTPRGTYIHSVFTYCSVYHQMDLEMKV